MDPGRPTLGEYALGELGSRVVVLATCTLGYQSYARYAKTCGSLGSWPIVGRCIRLGTACGNGQVHLGPIWDGGWRHTAWSSTMAGNCVMARCGWYGAAVCIRLLGRVSMRL